MSNKSAPVITEQFFSKNKKQVWNAISNPDEMRQWFFEDMPDYQPKVGFKTHFNVNSGERDFMHLWEITEVIPLKKIVCKWEYQGYAGVAFVSYELFEEINGCSIKVTASGIETFSDKVPEFRRESCEGGWKYFINQRLKDYLKNKIQ
jgi:uncharacterized protein YndB with AHSA1/START domain